MVNIRQYTEIGLLCCICNRDLTIENFRKDRAICKNCRHIQDRKVINSSIEKFINRSVSVARSRAKLKNIPFEITTEYMIQQYENQQGKCFYTDEIMTWGYGNGRLHSALSLDKIIPELGYVPGNSVFCCDIVNMIKRDLSLDELEKLNPAEWVKRAKSHLPPFEKAGVSSPRKF
jgi:hypothetical protein